MKPLLAVKVRRLDEAEAIREWIDSEHHHTDAGYAEFHARQLARIAAADAERQTNATERQQKVSAIKRRK